MFASAAREVVFANPEVVRRINEQFIPVALKAAMVNNPPAGIEGSLYAEIGRSKPAPQGICTTNSDGKVLAWALSFDDDQSILKFLDHVRARYQQNPDASQSVIAERFRKFPSWKLEDVADIKRRIRIPQQHADGSRCPATPKLQSGTLVGTIIGRALDEHGMPVADTVRQENYMEARLEIAPNIQEQLASAVQSAGDDPFDLPESLIRALVGPAFLGQLDVNPLGLVPGSQNDRRWWEFQGERVASEGEGTVRIRIEGRSHVEGGQSTRGSRTDGRSWEHAVTLHWYGFVEISDQHLTKLTMLATGDERLRWGNPRFHLTKEADVEHLMAGHPIDLDCQVRYGLIAEPTD